MKLLIYSYFPPRENHLAGGAQSFLNDLIHGLLDFGEEVTVLCPETSANHILSQRENLSIQTSLIEPSVRRLKPYERIHNKRAYVELANKADIVLSIDRAVPMETDTPVLLSVNNFSYSTEVDSVFSLCWDSLVVPSPYLKRCINVYFGRNSWIGTPRPISVIPLPVDTKCFKRVDGTEILKRLSVDRRKKIFIFPHRPDPDKGFMVALDALKYALHQEKNLLLLIPMPPESVKSVRVRESEFFRNLIDEVKKRGIEEHVIFHPWIDYSEMPKYYSIADYCLALSTLPEGFGLSMLQPVSCLTSVISTPAGAVSDLLPVNNGITFVPFNSPEMVGNELLKVPRVEYAQKGREYITKNYDIDIVLSAYQNLLSNTTKSFSKFHLPSADNEPVHPWYRKVNGRIWDDYEQRYLQSTNLEE